MVFYVLSSKSDFWAGIFTNLPSFLHSNPIHFIFFSNPLHLQSTFSLFLLQPTKRRWILQPKAGHMDFCSRNKDNRDNRDNQIIEMKGREIGEKSCPKPHLLTKTHKTPFQKKQTLIFRENKNPYGDTPSAVIGFLVFQSLSRLVLQFVVFQSFSVLIFQYFSLLSFCLLVFQYVSLLSFCLFVSWSFNLSVFQTFSLLVF